MPLQYDPVEAVSHICAVDPKLRKIVEVAGPLDIAARPGSFKSLGRAIFFQQLAGPAARAIMNRTLAALGTDEEKWFTPRRFLKAGDDELRAAGLSRQKILYLRDLAARYASGELSDEEFEHLDDEGVIARASSVKGIGRWTAEMFLMFTLGRPDVLPVDDLGVRRGMQVTYGLEEMPKPALMREIAEPWRPYRSAGTWYMWRALGVMVPEQGRGYDPEKEKELELR